MATGVNALESVVGRLKRKLPRKNNKISVVYMNKNGSINFDEDKEYNAGVLAVPLPVTEEEWEM